MGIRFAGNLCGKSLLLAALTTFWLLPAVAPHAQTPEDVADEAVTAESVAFDIPAGPMDEALTRFSEQSGVQLMYEPRLVEGFAVTGFQGTAAPIDVLQTLIDTAGLTWVRVNSNTVALQIPNGAGIGQRRPGIEEIIVTGQKREERIQDVPIAISAFSPEDLEAQKIEGGFDLLKGVPNVTFSKTNFSGYNFQIRGIGTQAVSATTDPAVAVSFNNTTLIVNRLFEQEYLDVERVEVLRGPQGTLFGRNATAGVINVISKKPELGVWGGMLDVEVGNYNTQRLRGMFNMPIGDEWAIRGAYASTKRDGYGINEAHGEPFVDVRRDVDGRDLWTGRLTIGWQPTDHLRFNLLWERFEEDDNRVRTSKQLCHRDEGARIVPGDEPVGLFEPGEDGFVPTNTFYTGTLTQACKPGSLYVDEAFGTPNGASLPYLTSLYIAPQFGMGFLGGLNGYTDALGVGGNPWHSSQWPGPDTPPEDLPCPEAASNGFSGGLGSPSGLLPVDVCNPDIYRGRAQSRDLRTIYSAIEPTYRASADIFELSFDLDLGNAVFSSQTVYVEDEYYASQDYNRFTSFPIWTDTRQACGATIEEGFFGKTVELDCSDDPDAGRGTFAALTDTDGDGVVDQTGYRLNADPLRQESGEYTVDGEGYVRDQVGNRVGFYRDLAPGGAFCDPQLGCSDSLVAQDLSSSDSTQFNQEFRLVSGYDGPWNFSLGASYTRFETKNEYYVFINALTYLTHQWPFNFHNGPCVNTGFVCRYVDPNPIESINGEGHNYFRSSNPYKLTSSAVFGELYWQATDTLKFTAGLRFTWDQKVFTPVASQLLLADFREVAKAQAILSQNDGDGIFGGLGNHQSGDAPGVVCLTEQFGRLEPSSSDLLHCPLTGTASGGRGFVESPDIVQEWREPTGRFVVDWQPTPIFDWQDEILIYASFSHGYKGGGANPPSVAPPAKFTFDSASGGTAPDVFKPEYVNAYEIGTKNTLFGGALTLNGTAFYYDYTDYQVSKIADRRAVNENFDAEVWGLEFEGLFAPTPDTVFNAAVGYLRTKVDDGEKSIDLIDRADGGNRFYRPSDHRPDSPWVEGFDEWIVVQPFVNAAANCVVPRDLIEARIRSVTTSGVEGTLTPTWSRYCPAGGPIGGTVLNTWYIDEEGNLADGDETGRDWRPSRDAPNGGAGFFKSLSGNELPNAPHMTVALGGQHTVQLTRDWGLTGRIDYYWQDESWARVYNLDPYDRLRSWSNTNLSVWATNPVRGLKLEIYVKNVFDETPITGTFLNSEDSGLTTNVFTLDPRLIGLSVTKEF